MAFDRCLIKDYLLTYLRTDKAVNHSNHFCWHTANQL